MISTTRTPCPTMMWFWVGRSQGTDFTDGRHLSSTDRKRKVGLNLVWENFTHSRTFWVFLLIILNLFVLYPDSRRDAEYVGKILEGFTIASIPAEAKIVRKDHNRNLLFMKYDGVEDRL